MNQRSIPLRNSKLTLLLTVICLFLIIGIKAQQGLKAEYYDGQNFERLVETRIESKIDQSWNQTPPVEGINPHVCSIRWTGKLRPGKTGDYTFSARVDDGIRVWVNEELVIDDWKLNDVGLFTGTVHMVSGRYYDLKVEYFNALIEGEIRLLWDIPKERKWYQIMARKNFELIQPEFFFQPETSSKPGTHDETAIASLDADNSIPNVTTPPTPTYKPKRQKVIEKTSSEQSVVVKEEFLDFARKDLTSEVIKEYTPKNILFERAKVTILEESFKELNRFAQFMIENPELSVKIEGHTEPIGNEEKNQELSERRAYAIAAYLVKKNVAHDRIETDGFGGSMPLIIPEDGKYFPGNRRVEFIVSDGSGQLLTAR